LNSSSGLLGWCLVCSDFFTIVILFSAPIVVFLFFFLALTHTYGHDGRNHKKFENNTLLFDFSFLQSIVDKSFVENYMSSLNSFVLQLNDCINKGEYKYFFFCPYHRHIFIAIILFLRKIAWETHLWGQTLYCLYNEDTRTILKNILHFWGNFS
jgi:hypothetical protein